MPFAKKFKHTFALPDPGGFVGPLEVVEMEVGHIGFGSGVYRYPIRMVVKGKGGQQGILSVLRKTLSQRRTTFSGYGNPYQLWFGKLSAVALQTGIYEVTGDGWGARVDIQRELERYTGYLAQRGLVKAERINGELYAEYFDDYQTQARRKQQLD